MSAPTRWIRLNISWDATEWVTFLGPAEQLAWIKLLCWTKAQGRGGKAKALSDKAAAKMWDVPVSAVQRMLAAAERDGAVSRGNGEWKVERWDKYQKSDDTAAERMRKYRSRQAALRRNDA